MNKGILVIGNESALFSAVCAQAAKRVEQYAVAIIPGPSGLGIASNSSASGSITDDDEELMENDNQSGQKHQQTAEKGKNILQWNPGSPLSARTLLIAAENRLGQIDEAILVCSPLAVFRSAGELSPAEIEKHINEQIKSWLFIIRELSLVFKAQNDGTIALVAPESGSEKIIKGKDAPVDLLGLAASASFNALTQGLIASREEGSVRIMGFSGSNAGSEGDIAAWIFKILDEGNPKNNGRWHKYSRLPFFR